jgi:hypothetical protein
MSECENCNKLYEETQLKWITIITESPEQHKLSQLNAWNAHSKEIKKLTLLCKDCESHL